MKKNILAIAIASAVAAPVAMADAPKVYGQMNLAIDSVSEEGMDVVHRNSRVGVKGSEDLGNGLKAVYQMEGTVSFGDDAKANNSFDFNRNTFAGVAGSFGTVVMGRHDTPLRMIQPKDGFADSKAAGNNTSNFNGLKNSGEDRINNVLAYLSPSFNGISFAGALASIYTGADREIPEYIANSTYDPTDPGSAPSIANPVADAGETYEGTESALTNAMSFSVAYGTKKSGIYAAAGVTMVEESSKDAEDDRQNTRLTVQYNEAGMLGYVMFNQLAGGAKKNTDNGNTITLGGAYKMGSITPRAKVAMITYDEKKLVNGKAEDSSMSMAVGVDYALGKQTRVYAEYAALDKNNRKYATVKDNELKDTTAISVGFFHKF
jgi:predicted porin